MSIDAQKNEALLAPEFPGNWMTERPYLWQMGLLTAEDLARRTGHFKLGLHFDADDVSRLWQLGLLRADLIRTTRRLRRAGIVLCGQDEHGRLLYTDERDALKRHGSVVGALAGTGPSHQDIVPLFHPFRFYVLHQLESALRPNLSPMVPLHGKRHYRSLYEFNLRLLKQMSKSERFGHKVDHWNDIAALATALEPCFYQRLFGRLTAPVLLRVGEDNDSVSIVSGDELFELVRTHIAEHWDRVAPHIETLGIEQLERVRSGLCVEAERLSPNKEINMVMRLQRGPGRLDTQGALGGAIYLHTMAELLRRAAERQFDTRLPEEDELGFGWAPPGLKRQRYGVDRLLDGDEHGVNAFLQDLGLSYNTYLSWYVEGTTEWSALDYVHSIVGLRGVRLINLRGKVAEGRDALIFADSLAADKHSKTYTFISIDGDRDDRIRAVKKAARDKKFFGRFFIAHPDFEFGNFDIDELEEVLWRIAEQAKSAATENGEVAQYDQVMTADADLDQISQTERRQLHDAIQSAQNGEQLVEHAQHALPHLAHLSKSGMWGRELMRYAGENPTFRDGTTRLIVAAVQAALSLRGRNYVRDQDRLELNADTGELELKRDTPGRDSLQ